MKHYLYADKEFIYSYLSQQGKGLNLSYSQMNKNTSTESETQSTQSTKENNKVVGKKDGDLTIGANIHFVKGEYANSSTYNIEINKNELRETLDFTDSKSEAQSELYKIELHDYLYEIFENTSINSNDKVSLFSNKNLTIAEMDKDHFEFLDKLMDIYIKTETANYIDIDNNTQNQFRDMKKDLKPLKIMSSIIDQLIPGDYKIIFEDKQQSLIGSLYKENLNVSLKELKYFYSHNKLNVVGIKASKVEFSDFKYDNVFEVIQLDTLLQGPLLNELLPNDSIYYFKPILIYSEI